MRNKILSLALACTFVSQAAIAEVPSQALTFDTNVTIVNATSTMTQKIRTAEELIKRVIATEAFRSRVINFTYNGVRKFVDNGGYTNEQIYQKILDGAEELNNVKDNEMDLEIEMYYASNSTVGYTYPNVTKIYANTKFYNDYTPATITSNMIHEWLHKLGFSHAQYYSVSRDSSVPYAIGTIMKDIARTINLDEPDQDYLTAAAGLSLSTTSTGVNLKWSAATSSNGIENYKVYRRLSGSTSNYLQGSTASLSYSQTRPTSSASYYVTAVDRAGRTIKSSEIKYTALSAPTNVTVTKTTTSAKVSWSAAAASAGIKEYKVYRRLSGSTSTYLQGTTTSLSFTQALPSKSAYYYVKAVDVYGATKSSSTVYMAR